MQRPYQVMQAMQATQAQTGIRTTISSHATLERHATTKWASMARCVSQESRLLFAESPGDDTIMIDLTAAQLVQDEAE